MWNKNGMADTILAIPLPAPMITNENFPNNLFLLLML